MQGRPAVNNWVCLTGDIVSQFFYDHKVGKERFYTIYIAVSRPRRFQDTLPLIVSEYQINVNKDYHGCAMRVEGYLRTYKRREGSERRIHMNVYVKDISFIEEITTVDDHNQVYLDGYLTETPRFRHTPLGTRISDISLEVMRPYGKPDYIPCIAWSDNASAAADLCANDRLCIWGRFQSREYKKIKGNDENSIEMKTAYEVSINKMECIPPAIDNTAVSC